MLLLFGGIFPVLLQPYFFTVGFLVLFAKYTVYGFTFRKNMFFRELDSRVGTTVASSDSPGVFVSTYRLKFREGFDFGELGDIMYA